MYDYGLYILMMMMMTTCEVCSLLEWFGSTSSSIIANLMAATTQLIADKAHFTPWCILVSQPGKSDWSVSVYVKTVKLLG